MKKVLQIIPDLEVAGAETMLENLINAIDKSEYNVVVVSLNTKHTIITNRLEEKGFRIIYLDKKSGFDIGLYKKLRNVFRIEKPDIIHTHRHTLLYTVIPAKQVTSAKMVHTVHNIAEKEVPKVSLLLQKIFFKYMKVVPVAISGIIQETICNQYNLNKEKVPIVFNAVDLNKCIVKTDYSNTNVVLHIGRFAEQKNHIGLIDIWNVVSRKFPNYTLRLIGQGELENEVKQKVEKLGLSEKVEFCGVKPECYVDMSQSDVFVLPSNYEGLPMTLIEAMGTGLPSVAYNVGGVRELMKNDITGYSVDTQGEFVSKLEMLLENKELREKLGRSAFAFSKEFSSTKMAKDYQKIYES